MTSPFDVTHTRIDLKALTYFRKNLRSETQVVMETTGNYYNSIAIYLQKQNIFVSIITPVLISGLRKALK